MPIQPRAYDPRFRQPRRRRGDPGPAPESGWKAAERLAFALKLEQERNERRPEPRSAWTQPRDEVEYHKLEDAAGARAFADHQHQIAERQMAAWGHGGADPQQDPRNDPAVERVLGPRPPGPPAVERPEPLTNGASKGYMDRLGRRDGVPSDWVKSAPPRPERAVRPTDCTSPELAVARLDDLLRKPSDAATHGRVRRIVHLLQRIRGVGLLDRLPPHLVARWTAAATERGIGDPAYAGTRISGENAVRRLLGAHGWPRLLRGLRSQPVQQQDAKAPTDSGADAHLRGPAAPTITAIREGLPHRSSGGDMRTRAL